MFGLYRVYSTPPRHESYCASGSLTASPPSFGINCHAGHYITCLAEVVMDKNRTLNEEKLTKAIPKIR